MLKPWDFDWATRSAPAPPLRLNSIVLQGSILRSFLRIGDRFQDALLKHQMTAVGIGAAHRRDGRRQPIVRLPSPDQGLP